MSSTMSNLETHWNILKLPQPPQRTIVPSSGVKISYYVNLFHSLEKTSKVLDLSHPAALCSRIIYKYKLKFRSMKWLKYVEKINSSLLKLLKLKINDVISKVTSLFSAQDNEVPSHAMLEWALLKVQGFVRLIVQLIIFCHQGAISCLEHLNIGHNWHILVVSLSLISQIWSRSHLLLNQGCTLYTETYHLMSSTVLDQIPWSSCHLPDDITSWIQEELNTLGYENILKIKLPTVKYKLENVEGSNLNLEDDLEEDLGEIISRSNIKSIKNNCMDDSKSNTFSEPSSKSKSLGPIKNALVNSSMNAKKKKKPKPIIDLKSDNDEIDSMEDLNDIKIIHEDLKPTLPISLDSIEDLSINLIMNEKKKLKKKKKKKKKKKNLKLKLSLTLNQRLMILNQ